jgi:iron complex transport system substrate-binding protein
MNIRRHLAIAVAYSLFSLVLSVTAQANAHHDQKLITAGGTITEIVFALGAGDRVIAVDQSSQFPSEVKQLPMVGYYRDLAAEGVLSFAPDKVLAIEGVGRNEVVKQIESTGVEVVIYKKPTDTTGLIALIEQLGRDLGKAKEAQQLTAQFTASLPEVSAGNTAKAVFLLSASERGLIAAGTETVPQLIFNYAGIENIGAQHKGFKGLNNEALALQQPDFLVAPEHVVMGAGGKEKFCQSPSLSLLDAAKDCRLLIMDSLKSLGMTPRLAEAIATVKNWQQEN